MHLRKKNPDGPAADRTHVPATRLTRRGFFRASAAAGVAGAAIGVLSFCGSNDADDDSEPVVVDSDSAVSVTADDSPYEFIDEYGYTPEATYTLPLGTVLRPAEGTWVPVTIAGSSATPMVKAGAFSSETGTLSEVVSSPVSDAATVVIYDVACSDSVYAWTELDTTDRSWTLYAAKFSDGELTGDPQKLWDTTSDYDPAPIACSGSKVIWQIQPSYSGKKTSEHSFAYVWAIGEQNVRQCVKSPGRFATKPTVSGANCILTPRVRADEGTYYGVTAFSISDNLSTKIDQLVLPASVKPFRATRVGDKFVISIEASYSTGGLLSKMGTYIGTRTGGFVKVDREPSECPAGHNGIYLVKSRSSYVVVGTEEQKYSSLVSIDRAVDYGEYPARCGDCELFVTFATVKDADTGYPASVTVRTFRLNA
ncbi:Tat pathway signal protein [Paratractidigestivibacter sp.]|uniref:Tat pathway signal protein n=1 Tax=Paratractidigestivibacter sp. TaxID=2847316 RepID=UPI002ABD7C0C|nr:Tat pathway signal protein [Paratractidigestivibacter sp.]